MTLHRSLLNSLFALPLVCASGQTPQRVQATPPAATVPTVVPALVPFSGLAASVDGKPLTGELGMSFLIYKDEHGGEPLWIESQGVLADAAGAYKVQLGAASPNGLPGDLFSTGEARWLEIQIAGGAVQPRILLASVPYALKAADSATLGGLPASAFALAGSKTSAMVAAVGVAPGGVTPDGVTNVTTTGGTSGYVPVFNGTSALVNSTLFQSSTGVGIGDTPNTNFKLDVNGRSILRGMANLANNGIATSAKGTDSFPLSFSVSAYNSSSKAAVMPIYYWQAEPVNNNSSNPGATLNLLYNNANGTGAETGLYLNSNGTVHFASGQTFTATGGSVTFNGNNTTGIGVEGTSTSSVGVEGNSTSSSGVYGHSSSGDGLLGVSAGTALHTAGVFGVAGTGNTSGFNGIAGVWGDASAHVGVLGTSTQYSGVQGQSANSFGVQGTSTSSYGVYGQAAASGGAAAGVYGYSSNAVPGVKGASASGDGGDFFGGGNGYGIQGIGGGAGGYGGNFKGGTATSQVGGGIGVYTFGGSASNNYGGGTGIVAFGGYGDSGDSTINGATGGIFHGGSAFNGDGGDGIYVGAGGSEEQTSGYAGYFAGNVGAAGSFFADVQDMQIDHPLDAANKYLVHASVGSSEMVNLYSGNVTTDGQGNATVELPKWFAAVNGDLRYQLTVVGRKAQAWISAEVADAKFQISSDTANTKVSWQITGVRQDPYAKAHPLIVEREKAVRERGFYMNPELYGQPAEKQSEWGRHPETMRLVKQHQTRLKIASQSAGVSGGN